VVIFLYSLLLFQEKKLKLHLHFFHQDKKNIQTNAVYILHSRFIGPIKKFNFIDRIQVLFIYQFHQFEGCSSFYLSISPVGRMQFFLFINFISLKDAVLFSYQFHQLEGCSSFYLSISPVCFLYSLLLFQEKKLKLHLHFFHQDKKNIQTNAVYILHSLLMKSSSKSYKPYLA
jgi:hypothetical protein